MQELKGITNKRLIIKKDTNYGNKAKLVVNHMVNTSGSTDPIVESVELHRLILISDDEYNPNIYAGELVKKFKGYGLYKKTHAITTDTILDIAEWLVNSENNTLSKYTY